MKRAILMAALVLLVAAGGCARWHKKPGAVVLPSGARMPPAAMPPATVPATDVPPPLAPETAPAIQPAAEPALPPQEPRRSWWRKKPRATPPPPAETPAPPRGRIYRMKSGDPVTIVLRGIPGYAGGQQNIEGILDENGCINVPFLNFVEAAGKTTSELEREITTRYIEEGYYRTLGVNIIIPTQSYFVRGEVRGPGRFQLSGGVTILQALASAGGFTEFANSRRVELLRGDQRILVNVRELEKYPARDKELEAGDVIIVPRSAF